MIAPMDYEAVVTRARLVTAIAIGAALWLAVGPADAGTPAPYVTDQVTFPSSGGLRIRALLVRPKGYSIFVPDAVSFLDAQLNR